MTQKCSYCLMMRGQFVSSGGGSAARGFVSPQPAEVNKYLGGGCRTLSYSHSQFAVGNIS